MEKAPLAELAVKFLAGFPTEITEDLTKVELLVCEDPAEANAEINHLYEKGEDFAADAKGAYVGDPMVLEESTDSEEDEIVYEPEGHIVLIASNIKDADELALVLMHEMGHALGMDEDEVKALGLGVQEAKEKATNEPTASPDNAPV